MEHDKVFVRDLGKLALPIILQNLLSTAVGAADTLMLNAVGQTALSATALANQVQFVLSLFFAGLTSGTGIMMAQYLGKGDTDGASRTFSQAMKLSIGVSFCFGLAAMAVPSLLMRLFTNDGQLVEIGSVYLRIVGLSYLFSSFSQVYLASLKARRKARVSAEISVFTLLLNVCLNAVFIFGLLGVPRMGVTGVAIATVMARFAELVVCLVGLCRTKELRWHWQVPDSIRSSFLKVSLPITFEGFAWGGAMAVLSAIMGRMGSDAVAANSVASTIQSIATVASFGFAEAGAILLGGDLGQGKLQEAKSHSVQLLRISVISGVICCAVMLLMEKPVSMWLNLTPQAMEYFSVMYKLLSVNVIFAAITYTMLCGIFPAGGDTRFGFYCDGAVMWGVCVLLGSIGAFVLDLNPIWVFVLTNIDELTKTPIVLKRYFKYRWLVNLTEGEPRREHT